MNIDMVIDFAETMLCGPQSVVVIMMMQIGMERPIGR
jgi:hypothetical protein